jgi:hypothetical protein
MRQAGVDSWQVVHSYPLPSTKSHMIALQHGDRMMDSDSLICWW